MRGLRRAARWDLSFPPSCPGGQVVLEVVGGHVPAHPSATVVLLRDGADSGLEVLLVQRNQALRHMGGMWVFPGGRVEVADEAAASDDLEAARHAAVRETAEEVGLVLAADDLLPLSHWTTPEGVKRRFATWFFIAVVDRAQEVQVDGGEIACHRWAPPQAVLDEVCDPEHPLRLAPPTFVSLTELTELSDSASARARFGAWDAIVYAPRMVPVEGGSCFLYAGDAGFDRASPDVPGPRHRAYMTRQRTEYIRQY